MLGKFSVKKPYTVLVAVILVIVLGVVSFTKMSTDLLPSISLPYVIVMTTYPGASPETVEMVVTKPVEASMATVSNIEGISSISSENYSTVILEFAQSTDMNAVSLEIRENLDQIKSYWSDEIGSPIIMKLNPDMLPVMIAAVGSTGMTDAQVSEMTQNLVIPELESIEGVASASATGLFEESVNVIIRQEKIDVINKQVFAHIDDEMKEAEQELADGRQEIYDGQEELAEARTELEEGKQELVDSEQELEDSSKELEENKQKLQDGKAEIAENKSKLEEGKSELSNKKSETTAQLAAAETKILTAKTDLEATKMHLTLEIVTAEGTIGASQSAIDQIDTGLKKYEEVKTALDSIDSLITVLDRIPGTPPGNTQPDSGTPGTTPTDPGTPGTTPTDPGTPGTTPTDPSMPGTTPTDPGAPGTTPTDPDTPDTTPTDPGTIEPFLTDPGTPDDFQLDPVAFNDYRFMSAAFNDYRTVPAVFKDYRSMPAALNNYHSMPVIVSDYRSAPVTFNDYQLMPVSSVDVLPEDVKAAISQILQKDISGMDTDTLKAELKAVKATLEASLAAFGGEEGIASMRDKRAELAATIEMQKAAVSAMKSQLAVVEENASSLDKALEQIYAGNLTAAIEFANAQTTISIGEMQLGAAETQLEASEKQLEAGEDQLEAGREQLEDAWEQIRDGEEQLNDSAEQLKDALQQILDGEEELEEAREDAYEQADMNDILTVDTVKSLLAAQNFSMPAGYVTEEGIDYLVRVGDKPEDIEELKRMPLLNPEMEGVDIITLADVADVFMTDNSDEIYANVNGEPGIMISIQKQTGYSTGDVSDRILDKFGELKEENENLILITLMDQGIYIDLVMDSIINNVLFGAILAVLILIVFLKDWRPTAVVACSIPVSLITAIVCMYFSGVTLNVISLSGLALGVGMLVDNSIVVIENIFRMRSEGYSAKEAATQGAGEVAGAILASTLTTVCVFLPIVFTEGIVRQLFVDLGLTIAYSLFASLLIALTVVPAMSAGVFSRVKPQKESRVFGGLMKGYGKTLELALRFKPVVLILVVILLAVSAKAAFSRGTAFMPDMDSTQITMTLSLPKDTPLQETADVTDSVIERIREIEEVTDVGAMASASSMSMLSGGGNSSTNETVMYISLREDKERDNLEIARDIQERIADIVEEHQVEASIETSTMDMSALGGSGISIQVKGRELDTLQEIAKDIAVIVESVEGTTDVSDGLEESTGELRILIDRDKAIEHGITVAQVFQQIQARLADAASATTLETEIEEYSVYVKHAKDIELTRDLVKDLELDRQKQDGSKEKIKLSDIAGFESTEAPKAVNRVDQTRYIAVSAAIAEGYNIGFVSEDVEAALADYDMPGGYTYTMSGENETINDAMEQVFLMLVLALIFMYLIMVAQFQSLLSPFIIMFTIPLAFTGGLLGLYISGSEVSVIALIGFVMLSGIIVNNGIVLVDYINQLRESGMEKREAIIRAGRTRIRPVLMTALTTILALSTMAFSDDMGADMSKPMSVVTIGGLIYGTLLTLIVIPCIYDIFIREKGKAGRTEDADNE